MAATNTVSGSLDRELASHPNGDEAAEIAGAFELTDGCE
jgi:hypothetical protein